jgi:hypothetical protein
MTPEEQTRLRELTRRLRQSHLRLFELQGTMIDGLQDALTAVKQEHAEMMAFFQSISDLEDLHE